MLNILTTVRSAARRGLLVVMSVLALPAFASAQSETVEYYGLDALGSVRVIFDAQGGVVDRMDYGPFGEALRAGINFPTEQFAQLSRDVESGKDYARARNYSTDTGRFNRIDPVGGSASDPQGWNRYAYASNNPLSFIDPDGMLAYYVQVTAKRPADLERWTGDLEPWRADEGDGGGFGFDLGVAGGGGRGGQSGQPGGSNQPPNEDTKEKTEKVDPCKVPQGPPGHDIAANVHTTKRVVRKLNTAHPASGFAGVNWWKDQVENNGPWDYKQRGRQFEDFGNMNYGATGRSIGLPRFILHLGAGAASLIADPERLYNGTVSWRYGFDDSTDYELIERGIAFVDNGCADKK